MIPKSRVQFDHRVHKGRRVVGGRHALGPLLDDAHDVLAVRERLAREAPVGQNGCVREPVWLEPGKGNRGRLNRWERLWLGSGGWRRGWAGPLERGQHPGERRRPRGRMRHGTQVRGDFGAVDRCNVQRRPRLRGQGGTHQRLGRRRQQARVGRPRGQQRTEGRPPTLAVAGWVNAVSVARVEAHNAGGPIDRRRTTRAPPRDGRSARGRPPSG